MCLPGRKRIELDPWMGKTDTHNTHICRSCWDSVARIVTLTRPKAPVLIRLLNTIWSQTKGVFAQSCCLIRIFESLFSPAHFFKNAVFFFSNHAGIFAGGDRFFCFVPMVQYYETREFEYAGTNVRGQLDVVIGRSLQSTAVGLSVHGVDSCKGIAGVVCRNKNTAKHRHATSKKHSRNLWTFPKNLLADVSLLTFCVSARSSLASRLMYVYTSFWSRSAMLKNVCFNKWHMNIFTRSCWLGQPQFSLARLDSVGLSMLTSVSSNCKWVKNVWTRSTGDKAGFRNPGSEA